MGFDLTPLPKGSTIGIQGAGQLGMFSAKAAKKLGFKVHIYAPEGDNPAVREASRYFPGEYDDIEALRAFAETVDVVTVEFENVPLSALQHCERWGIPVRPSPHIINIAQDRWYEKTFFHQIGVPATRTVLIESEEAIHGFQNLHPDFRFPALLKTRRGGYDGGGQKRIASADDLLQAWQELKKTPCVLEEFVSFAYEFSVIVARSIKGNCTVYPPILNYHKGGILRQSWCPGSLLDPGLSVHPLAARQGTQYAIRMVKSLDFIGLLAVEFFALHDHKVFANEIAPRPHNSGHGTLSACDISQFEQHIRAVAGWPLGHTVPHSRWDMMNLIGDQVDRVDELVDQGYENVFIYGKQEKRDRRKMGHVTKLCGPW